MLTQAKLKKLLTYDPETGIFYRNPRPVRCKQHAAWNAAWAGKEAGMRRPDGYIMIGIDYVQHRAHRLAFLYMTGKMPRRGDHKNRIRDDNRWDNLRPATQSQNLANGRHKNKPYKGVRKLPNGKWQARISDKRAQKSLGTYSTRSQAVRVYQEAAKEAFGEFFLP